MPELAVVIVNYKTPAMVLDCLATCVPELAAIDAKIVVVDNCSGDDSVELISNWITEHNQEALVQLIASPDNDGFSAGNNIGIKAIDAEYYLLLNSDTLVRPNAFSELLDAAKAAPEAGLVSPRLEWPDEQPQESCFCYHHPFSELIRGAATSFITRWLENYNVPRPVQDSPGYYQWTSFACILIKNTVIQNAGLLDAGYFMYFEDSEYCYRANQLGFKVLNVPAARFVHLRGGSSNVKSNADAKKRLPKYYYESRTRYFYQLYGRIGLFAANVFWTTGALLSIFRTIVQPNYSRGFIEKEWQDIWINFSNPQKAYTHPKDYDKA